MNNENTVIMKEIVSYNLGDHEIVVEDSSKKSTLKMTNADFGWPFAIYRQKENPKLEAEVVLTCNVDNVCHYIIVTREFMNIKRHLIESSEFDKHFQKKEETK
jgi:hypothetical protein